MRWLRRWDRWSRRAAAALVAAGLGLAAVLAGALHVEPPTTEGASPAAAGADLPPPSDGSGPDLGEAIRTAVGADPFREERAPPDRRYVLPAHRADEPADTRPAGRGRVQLVGTATFADRDGVAAFRMEDGRPRVAGPGSEVGGLSVVRVEEGRVVLSGPDTTLVLEVEPPEERR